MRYLALTVLVGLAACGARLPPMSPDRFDTSGGPLVADETADAGAESVHIDESTSQLPPEEELQKARELDRKQQEERDRIEGEAYNKAQEKERAEQAEAIKKRRAAWKAEQEAEAAAETKKRCDASRAERIASAKKQAQEYLELLPRILHWKRWVDAHCIRGDSRGFETTRRGSAVVSRSSGSADGARCNAPLPAGMMQEGADMIIAMDDGDLIVDGIDDEGRRSWDCQEADIEVIGVRLVALRGNKKEMFEKLAKLKK